MNPPNSQLAILQPSELVRQSTDIANLCKEVVLRTAKKIGDRKFLPVEAWMTVATAHGCIASAREVERVEGGFRAVAEIRRMSDGVVLSTAEGYVGEDEPVWFGGPGKKYNPRTKRTEDCIYPKRADYAIRSMCSTRAVSKACRTAFAHVVVLMNAGLATTPAEEVPDGGFDNQHDPVEHHANEREEASNAAATIKDWRTTEIHFGKKKGTPLAKLDVSSVRWYRDNAIKSVEAGKASTDDRRLLAACEMALLELNPTPGTKPAATNAKRPHDHLRSMMEFNNIMEDDLIAACHKNGMNSDVEKIEQMTDAEAESAIKNFEELCK